ncbi:MAG: hypothetical protein IPO14_08710 [Saprospiraceae bacterium]|nr:hypothetical protein [Saprospiraceae bacterium]
MNTFNEWNTTYIFAYTPKPDLDGFYLDSITEYGTAKYYYQLNRKQNASITHIPMEKGNLSIVIHHDRLKSKEPKENMCSKQEAEYVVRFNEPKNMTIEQLFPSSFQILSERFIRYERPNYSAYSFVEYKSYETCPMRKGEYHQALATYLSFAGESRKALDEFSKLYDKKPSILKGKEIAIDSLLAITKQEKLVLFNEAHHASSHRYLLGRMLKPLYKEGFRFLGMEAIFNEDSLKFYGFPTLANGFYIRDPVMGNLVREANHMGFEVFGYDSFDVRRDSFQAINIYEKLKTNPQSKAIILGGYGHISRTPSTMGGYLQNNLGLKYLSINQSNGIQYKEKKANSLVIYDPISFRDCDLYLQNNLEIKNNCFDLRSSKKVKISLPKKKRWKTLLVVFYRHEYEKSTKAIPTLVKVLKPNTSSTKIHLCSGEYVYFIQNENERLVSENLLTVKD